MFIAAIFVFGLNLLPGTSAMADGFNVAELVMQVMVLVLYDFGYVARMTRASMAEVMTTQYVRAAILAGAALPAGHLEVRVYWTRAGEIPAVIDFSLTVERGESVGLVGESGCGKSTVALAIMQYMGTNGSIKSGSITFKGTDLRSLDREALRSLRGSEIAMIYQEPFAAFNPALTIGSQLEDIPMFHEGVSEREALDRAAAILADCRLPDPQRVLATFPHQLSGGQQQRAVIAMALLSNPSLLLLDEPTTALDVTVEAGIVDLVRDIGRKYGATQIYISHNLARCRWCFRTPSTPSTRATPWGGRFGRVIKRFGVESDRRKVRERVLRLRDTVKLPRDFLPATAPALRGAEAAYRHCPSSRCGNPKAYGPATAEPRGGRVYPWSVDFHDLALRSVADVVVSKAPGHA